MFWVKLTFYKFIIYRSIRSDVHLFLFSVVGRCAEPFFPFFFVRSQLFFVLCDLELDVRVAVNELASSFLHGNTSLMEADSLESPAPPNVLMVRRRRHFCLSDGRRGSARTETSFWTMAWKPAAASSAAAGAQLELKCETRWWMCSDHFHPAGNVKAYVGFLF